MQQYRTLEVQEVHLHVLCLASSEKLQAALGRYEDAEMRGGAGRQSA